VQSDSSSATPTHLIRSLVAIIIGFLLLRAAAGAMGENINSISTLSIQLRKHPAIHCTPSPAVRSRDLLHPRRHHHRRVLLGELLAAFVRRVERPVRSKTLYYFWTTLRALASDHCMTTMFGFSSSRVSSKASRPPRARRRRSVLSPKRRAFPKAARAGHRLFSKPRRLAESRLDFARRLAMASFRSTRHRCRIPLTSPAFALNALIYVASLVVLWLGINDIKESPRPARLTSAGETWRTIGRSLPARAWRVLRRHDRDQRGARVFINLTAGFHR